MRRTVCLNMIVKNEAKVIRRCLDSVRPYIDHWVIVDTGSTDGTQDIVRAALADIPGELHERLWRDFGYNRSEALALARGKAEYLLFIDADDLLRTPVGFAWPDLVQDAYYLHVEDAGTMYRRGALVSTRLEWRWAGVIHEYLTATPAAQFTQLEWPGIVRLRDGARARDAKTYQKDAAILDAALVREPDNARYAFYLAQSRFDAGQFQSALGAYRRRVDMGGWPEEVFYSRYRAALCLARLGRPYEEVREAYEACFRAHPHRAEPLVRAATLARNVKRFPDAYVLARRATRVPKPPPDALFVEAADYDFRALDEQAIAAFYVGFPEESFDLCTELLERRELPDDERPRIEKNRDYSVPHVKDAFLRYDADLVARLASRPPSPAPRVMLSLTSCRRLDLFVGTVSSFLNACTDIDLVDRFLCVDDNSSPEDRAEMRRLLPFFEFVFKGPSDKGHARSLNLIRDSLRTPWLVHLEDDWHFFARRPYIGPAIEILTAEPGLGQVLFNRNYAETLEDREIPGGFRRCLAGHGHRYVVHEHYPSGSDKLRRFQESHRRPSNAWWPHYSLRPAVVRTSVFDQVGQFDEGATHFEHDYAQRYVQAGFASCFLDGVFALHTGRLTTERGDAARLNAYDRNGETQFGEASRPDAGEVLDSRPSVS
jgi:hypothetical protein